LGGTDDLTADTDRRSPPASADVPRTTIAVDDYGPAAALRTGHLRLAGLPRDVSVVAAAAVIVIVAGVLVVVVTAFGGTLPGGSMEALDRSGPAPAIAEVPRLAPLLALLGVAATVAALSGSAVWTPRRRSRPLLLGCALVDLVIATELLTLGLATLRVGGSPILLLTAIVAIAATVLLAVVPLRPPLARLAPVLGAIPALALLLAIVASPLMAPPDKPGAVAAEAVGFLDGVFRQVVPLVLSPLALWAGATWALASAREAGLPVVSRQRRWPLVLPAILGAKLVWLGLGLAALLPLSLGGGNPVFQAVRDDGPVAWALAVAYGVAAVSWIAYGTIPAFPPGTVRRAALIVVGGFTGVLVIGLVSLLAGFVVAAIDPDAAAPIFAFGDRATDFLIQSQVLTIVVSLLAGIVLVRRRQHVPIALFLLALGLWAAPRAASIVLETLGAKLPDPIPWHVELATVDAAVTVAVLVVYVVRLRRGASDPVDADLVILLVVATLLAHGSTIVPPPLAPVFGTLELVFPPLYLIAFGSLAANAVGPTRPARVLAVLGGAAAAVGLVAWGSAFGVARDEGAATVGRLLFSPPFALLVVAVTVAGIRDRARVGSDVHGGVSASPVVVRERKPVGAAIGLGATAVGVLVGGFVLDPTGAFRHSAGQPAGNATASPTAIGASPTPSLAQRLATDTVAMSGRTNAQVELAGRFDAARTDADRAAVGAEMARVGRDDAAWATGLAVDPCERPLVSAWAAQSQAFADIGDAAAGRAAPSEIDAAVRAYATRLNDYLAAADAVFAACGLPSPPSSQPASSPPSSAPAST